MRSYVILTERLIRWFLEIKDELEIREKERNTKQEIKEIKELIL